MGKRKNTSTIEFDTYTIRQPHYSKGDIQLKVPKGTVFTLYEGASNWSNDECMRELYTFTAVLPFTDAMWDFIHKNRGFQHDVENIVDKYIIWILKDIEPVEMEFPFTLEEYQLPEPVYVRMTMLDDRAFDNFMKSTKKDILTGYDSAEFNTCIEQSIVTTSMLKVNSIGSPFGADVTLITLRSPFDLSPCVVIKRGRYEYNTFFRTSYSYGKSEKPELSSVGEFNNALSDALQDLDIMF